jgi:hypothetical protein
MAKKKTKTKVKKKGPGILAQLAKGFAQAFDGSAEWVAKHTQPKPARQGKASMEWYTPVKGKPGEKLPTQPRDATWVHQTQKDKEVWRVTFMDGYVTTFVTWPPRDHVEAVQLAKEHVENLYGAYTLTWEVASVEKVGMAVEDELTEDSKA